MIVKLILKIKQIKSINKIHVVLVLFLLPFLFFYQNCGKMNAVKVGDNGNSINSIIPSHQIQMSANNSCALQLSTEKVKCWGFNSSGLHGNNGLGSSIPVSVSGLSGVAQVFFGWNHICALTSDNEVKCMGENFLGQLGNGNTDSSTTLVPVSLLSADMVTQISVGLYYSCALLSNQKVKCWGQNNPGQLGNGNVAITNEFSTTPVDVSLLSEDKVTQISAGHSHSCALLSDKKVKCWGSNFSGGLGNGNTDASRTPVQVSDLDDVTQISLGSSHSCALLSNQKVKCWGNNHDGQVGFGTPLTISQVIPSISTTPVQVSGLDKVTQISVGHSHSCALLSDKKVKCWGQNTYGQLGKGINPNFIPYSITPVDVSLDPLDEVTQISVGRFHSCALLLNKKVKCWGYNNVGQLGNGAALSNTSFSSTPVDVRDPY